MIFFFFAQVVNFFPNRLSRLGLSGTALVLCDLIAALERHKLKMCHQVAAFRESGNQCCITQHPMDAAFFQE